MTDTLFSDNQPEKKKPRIMDSMVEAVYQAYPRKTGKTKAKIAIKKALTKTTYGNLLDRVREFATVVPKSLSHEKYGAIPYPASFFNGDMYADNYAEMHCYVPPSSQSAQYNAWEREAKERIKEEAERKEDGRLYQKKKADASRYCSEISMPHYLTLKEATIKNVTGILREWYLEDESRIEVAIYEDAMSSVKEGKEF